MSRVEFSLWRCLPPINCPPLANSSSRLPDPSGRRHLLNDVNFLGGYEASLQGNVTTPLARPLALPPELAQLQHLQELHLVIYGYAEEIPEAWGRSGAFPQLQRSVAASRSDGGWLWSCTCSQVWGQQHAARAAVLHALPSLQAPQACSHPYWHCRLILEVFGFTLHSPLPPVEPGALPALHILELHAEQQQQPLQLPASWGRLGVWPSLQTLLTIQMAVGLPLPASWSEGFPQLTKLVLSAPKPSPAAGVRPSLAGPAAGTAAAAAAATAPAAATAGPAAAADPRAALLPSSWARGFPALQTLALNNLGLRGPFPAAWQAKGAFPSLRDL